MQMPHLLIQLASRLYVAYIDRVTDLGESMQKSPRIVPGAEFAWQSQ